MILLLDTSTPTCRLKLIDATSETYQWSAGHGLAKGLLGFLRDCLVKQNKTFTDISAIGVFKGPGSFTGLRIGLTVANTLADSLQIPIVGTTGEDWANQALNRLHLHENDHLVMPEYGSPAHVTAPRH